MQRIIVGTIILVSVCAVNLPADDKSKPAGDQAKMSAEMQQMLLQQFDVDKNGVLSDQEKLAAQEAMRKQGWPAGMGLGMTPAGLPGFDQFAKQFDKDGDGKLNDVERVAAMAAYQRARNNGNHGPVMGRLPYGPGGGTVGPANGPAAQGAAPPAGGGDAKGAEEKKVNNLIKRFDKDGDGKLNADEKATAQAELKKKTSKADKGKDK